MNRFDPPGGRPWGLFALCGGSLLLNLILGTRLLMSGPEVAPVQAVSPEPAAIAAEVEPAPVPVEPVADAEAPNEPAVQEPVPEPPPATVKTAHLTVEHSLARTFQHAGDNGNELSAVVSRLFVWDLDLRRDLMAGDRIELAYEGSGTDLEIPVARYHSKKKGDLRAYRYTLPGDSWPSWWTEDGQEVSRSLVDSPIHDYTQITSLLKDRPRHRGMDFKTPVGTPIVSPRSGVVTRTQWNRRNNGDCIEVQYSDGTLARFLHLSDVSVKPGQRVSKGTALGATGNSGRSTAPHLHYELSKNDKVVDPIDYHGVTRRSLPETERQAFAAEVARLDTWL